MDSNTWAKRWTSSYAQDTFTLPLDKTKLAEAIKAAGEAQEEDGPTVIHLGMNLAYYELNLVPKLEIHQDATYLTWKARLVQERYGRGQLEVAIAWRIQEVAGGVEVQAFYENDLFRTYFYQLKGLAKKLVEYDAKLKEANQHKTNVTTATPAAVRQHVDRLNHTGMITEYKIKDTVGNFVDWLDSYGRQHGEAIPSNVQQRWPDGRDTPLLTFWHHAKGSGVILFEATETGDILNIKARPIDRWIDNEQGQTVPDDEIPPVLSNYFDDLMRAICARWPIGEQVSTPAQQEKTPAVNFESAAGRHKDVCNDWAFGQYLLGYKPAEMVEDWLTLYELQKSEKPNDSKTPEQRIQAAISYRLKRWRGKLP